MFQIKHGGICTSLEMGGDYWAGEDYLKIIIFAYLVYYWISYKIGGNLFYDFIYFGHLLLFLLF